jgi:hypothetical protein
MSFLACVLLFFQLILPALFSQTEHRQPGSGKKESGFRNPLKWLSVFKTPINGPSKPIGFLIIYATVFCQLFSFVLLVVMVTWQQFTATGAAVLIQAVGNGTVTAQIGTSAIVISWLALGLAFLVLLGLAATIRSVRTYMYWLRDRDSLDEVAIERRDDLSSERDSFRLAALYGLGRFTSGWQHSEPSTRSASVDH